jgi:hypothetical protein
MTAAMPFFNGKRKYQVRPSTRPGLRARPSRGPFVRDPVPCRVPDGLILLTATLAQGEHPLALHRGAHREDSSARLMNR